MPSECTVDGCNKPHYALGYCTRHHWQVKRYGKILERTRFDENVFIELDDYYEMILFDKQGNEVCRTKISKCDYEIIKIHKWSFSKTTNYAYAHIEDNKIALHRYIMNPSANELVDHYNRDKLDNRRENLSIVDKYINSWNSLKHDKDNTYIKGVNYDSRNNMWRVRLVCKHKNILDNYYINREEAIITRLKAEKEYYGEFAPQRHLFAKYDI